MAMRCLLLSLMVLLSLFLVNNAEGNDTESSSSSSIYSEVELEGGLTAEFSFSYTSAERMLALMKANFGEYLERLPFFLQKYDGPMSQAARMALYWNKIDDLHSYYQEPVHDVDFSRVSALFPPQKPLYSHYSVFISPETCGKLDLLEWVQAGGTASFLVNSLTPLPLGILYRSPNSEKTPLSSKTSHRLEKSSLLHVGKIPPVSKKLLRDFEKKLSIFSKCYAVILSKADLSQITGTFFSFSELDAPLLSGLRFSNLIQLSHSSKESVSYFLRGDNEYVRSWLPRDFWRSIRPQNSKDNEKYSDFEIVNQWVGTHYFDLEHSFFAKGFRIDTLIQARRTGFILHRALNEFVWGVDKLPRYPGNYSTTFITLIETIMVEQIFLKFGVLPSAEEIETSPELAFKILFRISGAEQHFFDLLVGGKTLANLRRGDLPPLEPTVRRICVEHLTMVPGWPYLLERLQLSLDNFSWKSIPENWFSTLSQDKLYPLYDGGSWMVTRALKTFVEPAWMAFQRTRHFFTFITVNSFSMLNPVQQLDLILHPDAKENLYPLVIASLEADRFRLLYGHAASLGVLSRFKELTQMHHQHLIKELEKELEALKLQLQGVDLLDKHVKEKISNLE